ncbi:HET-domain-containing protein [Rhizodiscina lignyota]|uniref:HET-domain-containing protein n=1 Tax=Rhizodiscina lignyota TaxID=1504668 RepID=A0A9P4IHR9_9PEZI|nr:HET-domain-containing protein [Rhizodiscina lignyota]
MPLVNSQTIQPGVSFYQEPITKGSRDIRLLNLHLGRWEEDIQCDIRVVSLDSKPKYEAFSYTWGDASITKPIFVNSNECRATANLEAALRHIRRIDRPLVLWIDALCINQEDVAEKTHQVAMMAEIYRSCTHCYIWLGCPSEYFERNQRDPNEYVLKMYDQNSNPFELVSHFAQNKHWYELPCFSPKFDDTDEECVERLKSLPIWKGFGIVANSSWWRRVWTLQEVVLSSEATVIFGHWTIPWKDMVDADENSTSHEINTSGCCVKSRNKLMGEVYLAIHQLFDAVGNISFARKPRPTNATGPKFRSTQIAFVGRECHDPRDRVYGMLGLFSYGNRLGINPDYSLQLREAYTNVFQSMIEEYSDGDLHAMLGCSFNSNHAGLPSWVPNFAIPLDITLQRRQHFRFAYQYPRYQAAKNTSAKKTFEDGGIFHLSGVKVGVVTDVSASKRMDTWTEASKALSELAEMANVPKRQTKATGAGYDSRYDMFWRTVISDIVYLYDTNDYRRLSDDDYEEFERFRLQAATVAGPNPSVYHTKMEFAGVVCCSLDNRCFFLTEEDRFGTGPPGMEAGDQVWVLLGGRIPFVLRPVTNVKQGSRSEAYNFIGDCYLHGVMDGQALDVGAPEVTVALY